MSRARKTSARRAPARPRQPRQPVKKESLFKTILKAMVLMWLFKRFFK